MKNLFALLLLLSAIPAYSNQKTFNKLTELNKCWPEQPDLVVAALPAYKELDEKAWIKLHLSLVEKQLRSRNNAALNSTQLHNRLFCLDILNAYWQQGNFPQNKRYAYRTPIFIDDQDNFCAVGFLLKASGYESVSRKICASTNLAYVKQMNYPELGAWASDNGFTIDELAWIQPSYYPEIDCGQIGQGVNGFVQELYVDETTQQMFVGGRFTEADKAIATNNIAYVTEHAGAYTWHAMGAGVDGKVNAIAKFDDKIFVAGSFNTAGGLAAKNIAYWDGASWHEAGCVDGVVHDLIVFDGALYAAGSFKSCGTDTGENFAKWDGAKWKTISGIEGRINTMEVINDDLVLGGSFTYSGAKANVIKWNRITGSFVLYSNTANNEVMDFEIFKDSVYAACKRTNSTDSNEFFLVLRGSSWLPYFDDPLVFKNITAKYDTLSFNTICSETSRLNFGGYFRGYGKNSASFGASAAPTYLDSTVNKIVLFKGELIFGGYFKNGEKVNKGGMSIKITVNGIAKRKVFGSGIENVSDNSHLLSIYPNPAMAGTSLTVENDFDAESYLLTHITGAISTNGKLAKNGQIQLNNIPAGMYFITLSTKEGKKVSRKIVIQ